MLNLAIMIAIYLIANKLSEYTLLANYEWYNDLSFKLYEYEGKYKSFLTKLYYFKIFTCKSCNVFWISLVIYILLNLLGLGIVPWLEHALIIFLIHKVENNV